jgi:excisionase family DNA binding protein
MKQLDLEDASRPLSDLLTVPEAAEYLRISEWTLRHWVSDKKIRYIKMGHLVRFRKAHLDRFILDNLHGKEVKVDS